MLALTGADLGCWGLLPLLLPISTVDCGFLRVVYLCLQ